MSVVEAEQSPNQEPPPSPAPQTGAKALLSGRIEIDLDEHLREFETVDVSVFFAFDQRDDEGGTMMAYVCRSGVAVRNDPLAAVTGKMLRNVLSVVANGLISVPGSDQLWLAVVLERPLGGSLAEAMIDRGKPFDEHVVLQDFLPQFVAALRDLQAAGVTHRAIRPGNVFFVDADHEKLVLGEFITSPAGSCQPPVFEPLESALAMPDGRGAGTMRYDTYALGVTLLSLLTGSTPGDGQDPDELIEERLTQSSFTALAGGFKMSVATLDLLRGLLCDDVSERWDLNEIDAWMRGRRSTTNRAVLSQRANRPFAFESREHTYDLALAAAFARHPKDSAEAIASEEFQEWLRLGLKRPELVDKLAERLRAKPKPTRGGPSGKIDPVTTATTLLDPMGPLRRDQVSIAMDGFGPVLAASFANNDQGLKTSVMRLLTSEAPKEWIAQRRDAKGDLGAADRGFTKLLVLASSTALGSGAERCLYELNAGYPCQSPAVAKEWAVDLPTLLRALDDAAASADKSTDLLDRHIAAFIATYMSQAGKLFVRFSRGVDNDKAMLALEVFAMMQARCDMPNLRNLTRWLGTRLDSHVASYRSRTRREYVRARIAVAQEKGDITSLQNLVNSLQKDSSDATQFETAQATYANNETEILEMAPGSEKVAAMGRVMGARAVRWTSVVLLLMSAALLFIGAPIS